MWPVSDKCCTLILLHRESCHSNIVLGFKKNIQALVVHSVGAVGAQRVILQTFPPEAGAQQTPITPLSPHKCVIVVLFSGASAPAVSWEPITSQET